MNELLHKTARDCNRKLAISSDFSRVEKIRISVEAENLSINTSLFQSERRTVSSQPLFNTLPHNERSRVATFPAVGECDNAPEGPGTCGNKPLMRNRKSNDAPRDRYIAGNTFQFGLLWAFGSKGALSPRYKRGSESPANNVRGVSAQPNNRVQRDGIRIKEAA
jgi:hypothetical protein